MSGGGGDNGYLANMNLETIRHLNTVTCCFADDFQAKDFEANEDSTTDICRYNLAPPPEQPHQGKGEASSQGRRLSRTAWTSCGRMARGSC